MKNNNKEYVLASCAAIIAILVLVLPIPPLAEIRRKYFLLQGDGGVTLWRILAALAAASLVLLLYYLIKWLLTLSGKKSNRALTVTGLLAGAIKYLAVIIGAVWCLSILGVNAAAVLAGVGIIGLILGFGAQSLIEDVITGVFIIFEGQYNVGDIIVLDDFRGTVRSIGVRTTVIEDAGGNLKIVNNSDIRKLQNRSKNTSVALCDISVSYGTDLMKLEDMLSEELPKMLENNRELYLDAPKYLGVAEFQDSGILLKFCVRTLEANVFPAQRRLNRDIKVLFDRKGVEIPFPQVVVHQAEK